MIVAGLTLLHPAASSLAASTLLPPPLVVPQGLSPSCLSSPCPLPSPAPPACLQMTVNLTADHRVVYGAHAAEFLLSLKAVIESPDQLVF